MYGHNQPSIDSVVEENLLRGLYLSQLNALMRCVEDPRMTRRHHCVLAQIIQRTNVKTGYAYPGRARLAEDVTYYVNGEVKRYSEATIATTISELIDCGYIVAEKRAVDGKGRALAHYATTRPSTEDLQRAISDWCTAVKGQPRREFPRAADVDTSVNVDTGINVTDTTYKTPANARFSEVDVDTGLNVDTRINVDTGIPTVTGREDIPPTALAGGAPSQQPAPRKRAIKNRTRIPDDWQPSLDNLVWVKANFTANDRQIAVEAEKFRDYHQSRGSTMASWSAAWRTWWGTGYHKIPRRIDSVAMSTTGMEDRELAEAFERARLADEEEARCRR